VKKGESSNHYDYCDHVYCKDCPDDGWCCKFIDGKCIKHPRKDTKK